MDLDLFVCPRLVLVATAALVVAQAVDSQAVQASAAQVAWHACSCASLTRRQVEGQHHCHQQRWEGEALHAAGVLRCLCGAPPAALLAVVQILLLA